VVTLLRVPSPAACGGQAQPRPGCEEGLQAGGDGPQLPPEMFIRADRLLSKSRDPQEPDHPPLQHHRGGAGGGRRPRVGAHSSRAFSAATHLLATALVSSLRAFPISPTFLVHFLPGYSCAVGVSLWLSQRSLLRERAKGEDSFWAPFLAVLPEHVALPVYWEDEFVGALEYEPAEGVVRPTQGQGPGLQECLPVWHSGRSFGSLCSLWVPHALG